MDNPTLTSESIGPTLQLRNGQTLTLPERKPGSEGKGLSIQRYFSEETAHPYLRVNWIRNTYKKTNFQREIEAPDFWAYNDVLITGEKYLFGSTKEQPEFEDSLRHPIDRISNTYTIWGWAEGYFRTLADAEIFNEELKALQIHQIWAPNSPVWFNIGHWEQWRWGRPDLRDRLKGGNKAFSTRADVQDGIELEPQVFKAHPAEFPQTSACFLTEIEDSMEAILEHFTVEGRIFASGSGVGINLSSLRSSAEPITGKGRSSGPISFDKGFDRSAGSIKSGGKTRRAARMSILFSDHPDIFRFVQTKNDQEDIGKIILKEHNTLVNLKSIAAEKLSSPISTAAEKVTAQILLAIPEVNKEQYSAGMDDLLYGETLSHQNANHSVSLKGDFWQAYKKNADYSTRWVTKPDQVHETFPAAKLMDEICKNAWDNAEPGTHNNDWINLWNPVKTDGAITTSNPCSEYLHLTNTACNLSSFNAYRFLKDSTFDTKALDQGALLAMICADLNIQRGGFPIPEIAAHTRLYRTTGIGYTNIGGTIMALGIPYDSDAGRFVAAHLVAALNSSCWKASALLAKELGAYEAYHRTGKDLREVLNLHEAAFTQLQNLDQDPSLLCHNKELPCAQGLAGIDALRALKNSFTIHRIDPLIQNVVAPLVELTQDNFYAIRHSTSFRNSFTTLCAPTGTISFPLGAYTLGTSSIEPDYSLVKLKNLSGGGHIAMFNQMSLIALRNLGYSEELIKEAALEVAGTAGLFCACSDDVIATLTHLRNPPVPSHQSGPVRNAVTRLLAADTPDICLLASSDEQLLGGPRNPDEELAFRGKNHLEQVPWIKLSDLPVFDCSATQGDGKRSIHILGHLRMLGAIQPFLSGAASKTCNLPYDATIDDFRQAFAASHEMGVKCIALYRADSKGISVYSTDTPEGKKFNAQLIWEKLVALQQQALDQATSTRTPAAQSQRLHPKRLKLRGRRTAQTVKFQIQGLKGYLTVGTYPDGSLGEIFCKVGQSGTFASGILDSFCKSISVTLQYGVPLEEIIEDFRSIAFEPAGFGIMGLSGDDEGDTKTINVSSIIDMLAKMLDYLFPAETGRKLRPVNLQTASPFEELTTLSIDKKGHSPLSTPVSKTIEIGSHINHQPDHKRTTLALATPLNFGGTLCPKCHQMSYIQDGKCKRCNNPSCGYKDGGCGE